MSLNKAIGLEKLMGTNTRQVLTVCLFALLAFATLFVLLQPADKADPQSEWNAWSIQKQDRTTLALNFHEVQQLYRLSQKTPIPKGSDDHPASLGVVPPCFLSIQQTFTPVNAGSPQAIHLESDRIRDPPNVLLLV